MGIHIHAMSKCELVEAVLNAVEGGRQCIIGNHNLHSLYMWLHEPRMREFYSLSGLYPHRWHVPCLVGAAAGIAPQAGTPDGLYGSSSASQPRKR